MKHQFKFFLFWVSVLGLSGGCTLDQPQLPSSVQTSPVHQPVVPLDSSAHSDSAIPTLSPVPVSSDAENPVESVFVPATGVAQESALAEGHGQDLQSQVPFSEPVEELPAQPVPLEIRLIHASALQVEGGTQWGNYSNQDLKTAQRWVVSQTEMTQEQHQPEVATIEKWGGGSDPNRTLKKQWFLVFPNILENSPIVQATFLQSVDRKDYVSEGGSRFYSALLPVSIPLDVDRQERYIPLVSLFQTPEYGPDQIHFSDHQVLELDLVNSQGVSRRVTLRFRVVPALISAPGRSLQPRVRTPQQSGPQGTYRSGQWWVVSEYKVVNPTQRNLSLWIHPKTFNFTQSNQFKTRPLWPDVPHLMPEYFPTVNQLARQHISGVTQVNSVALALSGVRFRRSTGTETLQVRIEEWQRIALGPLEEIVLQWEAQPVNESHEVYPAVRTAVVRSQAPAPPAHSPQTAHELAECSMFPQLWAAPPAPPPVTVTLNWEPWALQSRKIEGTLGFDAWYEYDSQVYLGQPAASVPDPAQKDVHRYDVVDAVKLDAL